MAQNPPLAKPGLMTLIHQPFLGRTRLVSINSAFTEKLSIAKKWCVSAYARFLLPGRWIIPTAVAVSSRSRSALTRSRSRFPPKLRTLKLALMGLSPGLGPGRNAMAIWQDLVSEYGFASSSQSVQRFVRKRRGVQTPDARVVIVTATGQEAQVD